jgi:hypothetical protein
MPRVLAYHPEIFVREGKEVCSISLVMDDWYSDSEIFGQLATWTGAGTLGGAVAAIKSGNTLGSMGNIISARIEYDRDIVGQVYQADASLTGED